MTAAITVVGEALVDVVRAADGTVSSFPGGSPANVAVGLARLGVPVALLTRLGRDQQGEMLSRYLKGNQVALLSAQDELPTSTAEALLDSAGAAQYRFNVRWSLSRHNHERPITGALHTGSLATVLEPGAADVVSLVERSRPTALISYDPNCRPSLTPDREQTVQAVEAFLGLVDVVKVSRDDLAWLYPRRRWREVVQQWLALGPALAVVTHGEQGASGVTRRGEVSVPTRSVHVVDTVGAGDSFTAAMLSYLHSRGLMTSSFRQQLPDWAGADIREMLEMAALAAAITCSHPGADPPTAEQLGTFRD